MVSMGLSLKPTNLPEPVLAYKNLVFAASSDVSQLCGNPSGGYIDIKDCIFTLASHGKVEAGSLALNKIQREFARVGLDQPLFVRRFVPPPAFELGSIKFEVDFLQKQGSDAKKVEIQDTDLEKTFRPRFDTQVFKTGQTVALDYEGSVLKFVVQSCLPVDLGDGSTKGKVDKGMLGSQTELEFQQGTSGKLHVLSNKVQQRSIFRPDFNFEELGIGGLTKEFGNIFRRAFAARVFPPHVVRDMGINHVRGMLLFGPPGTGKTLIARQLAKFLKAAEPKIVNGPEILNKYVGQAEENIRNLFADAEREYKQQGEASQLHVVIFDEIDSICKSRGSSRDGTGVHDSIVNQLLSKIDGVDSLNNILLIGMTNRMDLIDEALLRPGRLEVHVEISLPDESGRVEILHIHTKNMRAKGYLDKSVSIPRIAAETKNFSGAELEGLIRSASSYALNRQVDFSGSAKSKDMGSILVTREDFDEALLEIKPAFGVHTDEFDLCAARGITSFSEDFEEVLAACTSMMQQVRSSANTPLLSLLLYGAPGCGKTALSAHLARISEYPFVRRIAPENYVGYTELAKVSALTKIFDDAYKSPLSLIVLDDLERLMDYVRIGHRFSNVVLQALWALFKKQPPKQGRRLLIIGTTSDRDFLENAGILSVFNATEEVPPVRTASQFEAVLREIEGFGDPVLLQDLSKRLDGTRVGIKTLLVVAEMAIQRHGPGAKDLKEIFLECLKSAAPLDGPDSL